MRPTLHLQLKKGTNKIRLAQKHFFTTYYNTLRITNVVVFWTLENIRSHNNTISVDSVEKTIPQGYYTFDTLKIELKKHDVEITQTKDRHTTISSSKDVDLRLLATLLGFEQNTTISRNTPTTSPQKLSMTGHLDTLQLYTNLIDDSINFHHYPSDVNTLYESQFLCQIPIDTTLGLDGVYSHYDLSNVSVPARTMKSQDFYIDVVSEGHQDDYTIFLDLQWQE